MRAMERLRKLKIARPDLFEDNPTKACMDMYAEMRAENEKLKAELAALKTPPRCPKCGSSHISIEYNSQLNMWHIYCDDCKGWPTGVYETTIDAALNAWRKV